MTFEKIFLVSKQQVSQLFQRRLVQAQPCNKSCSGVQAWSSWFGSRSSLGPGDQSQLATSTLPGLGQDPALQQVLLWCLGLVSPVLAQAQHCNKHYSGAPACSARSSPKSCLGSGPASPSLDHQLQRPNLPGQYQRFKL